MKRTDIEMSDELKSFLEFDLGHLDHSKFQHVISNIVYDDEHKMDIYYPSELNQLYPCILIVYGGGWISGYKESRFVEMMLGFLKLGYACAVCDYTLALDACFPKSVIDIKNAINFLHKNQKQFHLSDKLYLFGESAGGHIALVTCLTAYQDFHLEELDERVDGVIAFYPVTDFETVKHGNTAFLYDIVLGKDNPYHHLISPIHLLHDKTPPIVIQHGLSDTLVDYHQSQEFAKACKSRNIEIYYETFANKVHTDSYFFTIENLKHVMEFFNEG